MKIIALEEDLNGTVDADSDALLLAEARAVWQLMQAGTIRQFHFREGRTQAVIMLEAESSAEAGIPGCKISRWISRRDT